MLNWSSVRRILKPPGNEGGQVLIMAAGSMALVLSIAALAIDVGLAAHTKRDLQNDVDAMVLAAVREMPDANAAQAAALSYGGYNAVSNSEVQQVVVGETCDSASLDGTVTARLQRNQKTFLAGLMGIGSVDLSVCATARIGVAAAGDGILPFGFLEKDPEVADVCYFEDPDVWNNSCLLKIPKPNDTWAPGNTGPIRLDEGGEPGNFDPSCNPGSSGSSEYKENIEDGGECWYAVNDEVRTKTGSMVGPTCTAFANLLGGNSDTIEQVFGAANAQGFYTTIDRTSPRFGIVPIVNVPEGATGSSTNVTITGFMAVYIEDACDGGGCNGQGNNPACVVITPMKSYIYLSGVAFGPGSIDDTKNALRTMKLVN